jgi:hypothetical protein
VNIPALIFISAAVYLLNHIYRLDDGFAVCLFLFLLGIVFIIPLILTKRLWFTGGMHWAGNSFFYFTHALIKTGDGDTAFSANYTMAICTLLLIPLNYFLLKKMEMIDENWSKRAKMSMAEIR